MNHRIQTLLVIFILVFSGTLSAAIKKPLSTEELSEMRRLFVMANSALERGQISRYRHLAKKLENYPLYPYLIYEELRRNLKKARTADIQAFLTTYEDTPLARKLHYRWLKTLARQKRVNELIEYYQTTSDKSLHCAYARALYSTGHSERAHNIVEGLWLTGNSLPRNCDLAIRTWEKAGKLTQELLWKRIHLAMRSGKTRLAKYLAKKLDKKEKYLMPLWLKVRRSPSFVAKAHHRFGDEKPAIMRWIVADGLSRLARKQPQLAYDLWQEYKTQYTFSPQQKARIKRNLIRYLSKENLVENQKLLAKLALNQHGKKFSEQQIFSAITDHEWQLALNSIEQLPKNQQHEPRWLYWRGRSLEALGRLEEARSTYLLNSDDRNYYSFLASDRAGSNYHLAHRPLSFEQEELSSLNKIPAFVRARELFVLERQTKARSEWQWAVKDMSKAELLKAASLANQWGWYDRAILTLALARYWDDLELRFPLAHRKLVVSQARRREINPAWAFAVIRQESAFTPDARSHAGAMGLMQLMPSTARQVARNLKMRFRGKRDLLDVKTNISLGVSYLKKVQDRFDGHEVLATAAYNAGGHRVKQWLPEDPQDADIWIEMVPFDETRGYLKRVLTYTAIYEQRLGMSTVPISQRMPPVQLNKTLTSNSAPKISQGG
ncbi:MAG: transglycosylase SLT domain-containing protein [Gammaproteobacteria bacterium]